MIRSTLLSFLVITLIATGCGSTYTNVDRSTLEISQNSKLSARNLVPRASEFPSVVEQLALAQEVYQKQLFLLKDRRNKLRARKRYLNAFSFGTFAATTIGVGAAAIHSSDDNAGANLQRAGYAALGGLAVGTLSQVAGFMQDDASSVDGKVRHLELLYDTMIERLRQLTYRDGIQQVAGTPGPDTASNMGAAIESFITQALAINIKG
tara:strand:- start:101778 stop:102401 length:624 start_codon:yes stop_codon:yes gene_type:complete